MWGWIKVGNWNTKLWDHYTNFKNGVMDRGRASRIDRRSKRFKFQYHVQRGKAHQKQSIPDDGRDHSCYEFFNTSERNELHAKTARKEKNSQNSSQRHQYMSPR